MKIRVAVITASDSGASGHRKDRSGPLIIKLVEELFGHVVSYSLLPDDRELLSEKMAAIADQREAELILTTGGTGFSSRDCMPEATAAIIERLVPGIPEALRAYSMQFTGRAMLSRAVAGIRQETLIVNLPGSPKAVQETLEYIYPHLEHGIEILTGNTSDCAQTKRGPYIFAFCGSKNAGKTTFLTKLIPRLQERSYRVAVIKHDGHDFEADQPHTDSDLLKKAGAYGVAVFSQNRFFVHKEHPDITAQELAELFPESDLILVEGLKGSEYNKFELMRAGITETISSNRKGLLGIITDLPHVTDGDIEIIAVDDIDRIISIMEKSMSLQ